MLSTLKFSDLYLGQYSAWMSGVPGGVINPVAVPETSMDDALELRKLCESIEPTSLTGEFAVRHSGLSYRAATLNSMAEKVYVLRRFPAEIPVLANLGLHPGYVAKLMQPKLSGLIVIAGTFGQGKTTTASSIITARLSQHGGVAVTIEDPPEMPLQGQHGKGICYQTWVEQGGFAGGCRQAARWAPSIIFLGEVRDPETASEALRVSINGGLVICTTHADSVTMAVERLYSLASAGGGSPEDISSLLSGGLLCVVHQKLEGEPRRPKIEFLWLGDEESHGIRNTIRSRRFEQIPSEVSMQLNRMLSRRGVMNGLESAA